MARIWEKLKALLQPPPEAEQSITVAGENGPIEVRKPYQPPRVVRLEDIEGIDIKVTTMGPMLSGLYWVLMTAHGEIAIPVEGDHAEALLRLLQNRPHFDQSVLKRVMQRTCSGRYPCWRTAQHPCPDPGQTGDQAKKRAVPNTPDDNQ